MLKLDYDYGTTSNNGNVKSQTITISNLTVNQCYGYDYLNRLTSAEEKSGGTPLLRHAAVETSIQL